MISINTNSSSSLASLNLQKASDLLQRSLVRLSSGSRIATPSDDAGGLAVSMKLSAATKRTQSAAVNVSNAISMLQVQAGTLKSAASVLDRLSELATLGSDVTKTTADISNYCTEFNSLVSELNVLTSDSFNGTSLFCSNTTTGTLTVFLSQDGSQSMTISQATLANAYSGATDFSKATAGGISTITSAVQNLAGIMAQNGSESSRLQFALDSLNVNQVNLEAANSRIYDVDVAAETAKLARANILVQAGAAMLTQANASQSIALKLLQ
jgi:flagellin